MGFRNLKKSGFAFRQNKKQNRICNKATLSRTATMLQLHPVLLSQWDNLPDVMDS